MKESAFWAQNTADWIKILGSSDNGLSSAEAARRLKTTGFKRVPSRFEKDVRLFVGQFKSPLMLLLIGAVLFSTFLGDFSDTLIIVFILLATGLISFFQERNAGKVVEKLQALITLKSTVRRNGVDTVVLAKEVVPGDILLCKAGDIVPADCLVLNANELNINEASLTGESFPVRKSPGVLKADAVLADRTNSLWEGTHVVSGNAQALVINTGSDTIFGSVIKSAETVVETSFEAGLKNFGFLLMRITLVLSVAILVVNLLNHKSIVDSALFALALAVGMAPELLPAITTIAMSTGAKHLLDKKVVVKKLNSIQNLGEINLLCTDKTGTITEGRIEIERIVDTTGEHSDFVQLMAYWNAYFETGYANPIDEAIRKLNLKEAIPQKTGEIPYDFIRKRLSVAIDNGQEKLLLTKGAFAQCLEVCTQVRLSDGTIDLIENHKQKIEVQFETMGQSGVRSIAICYKSLTNPVVTRSDEQAMIFAGFILMKDPVKPSALQAIEQLRRLNIGLKIITGDNKIIAQSVGREIGIANPVVITGKELLHISPEALVQKVKQAHIFSEVEPQQKESLIRALRKSYSVAYIGDGINDVSAISAADVGITVDNATDVAREAADFILLEKNLSVIADGVQEGRKTFANTLKYIYISTGSTFGNMCSVAAASVLLPFLPMLPKQILLTNFLTDFPFLSIPSDNVDEEQVEHPGKWSMKLIKNYMIVFGIHSSLFDLLTFSVLYFYLKLTESAFQTGWFIESILTELLIFYVVRTRHRFFSSRPAGLIVLLGVLALASTVALPYLPFAADLGFTPLPLGQLLLMLSIVALYVLTADVLKVWFFRRLMKAEV